MLHIPFRLNSMHRELVSRSSVWRNLAGHVSRRPAVRACVRHGAEAIFQEATVQAVATLALAEVD